MQLAGKLALSAVAALLLLTLAYRFYKSRTAASSPERGIIKADTVKVAGQKENSVPDGSEAGEAFQGLSYRQVSSNGVRQRGGKANQTVHLGGTFTAGTQEPQSTPPSRDQNLPNGEEEEEKGKETRLQVSESQPDKKSALEEKEEGKAVRTILSSTAGGDEWKAAAGADLGGKQNFFTLVGPVSSSDDDSRESGSAIGSDQLQLCLSSYKDRLGTGLEPGTGNAPFPNAGKEQYTGEMNEPLAWIQEAQADQERTQTIQATSDMGLAIKQSDEHSDASYVFSSVAKIQPTASGTGLRGKVYDYYFQSTSHSVSKGRPYPYATPAASLPTFPSTNFSRKDSFLQIAENPELQVQMDGFSASASPDMPPLSPLHSGSVASLVGSMHSLHANISENPKVENVAGANFFQVPLSLESSVDIHLDLGNCYDVLCVAKKQKLDGLKEAAYKVMSDNYLQVLRCPSIYGRLNAMERDLILQRRMKGRKYVTVADISTQEHSVHSSRLCYYDDQGDTWHHLTHIPLEAISRGCAMCSMFNYLFMVAGCKGPWRHQKPSNKVFCYNPITNIWREICPLNQARPQCKLVALDGYIYAIGGECLYTVERYDPRVDRWTFSAPLPNDTFAVAHIATACGGEIYVTGGTLRYMLLRYVCRSDTWKVSLTGGSKDRTTEMVTANGFIYRFDLNRSMGISVYRCSAKAKLWYECATNRMPYPACFQCAVVDNLIYCISRQFNIRFLADYVSPRFGVKELQAFPSAKGTLFPVVLMLPDRDTVQTRV
uniref:Kelch domain containing 7A n=1 Tax=Sphenodon punctatus TaxID=8508 RepID=A0A8D0G134_SPHPU